MIGISAKISMACAVISLASWAMAAHSVMQTRQAAEYIACLRQEVMEDCEPGWAFQPRMAKPEGRDGCRCAADIVSPPRGARPHSIGATVAGEAAFPPFRQPGRADAQERDHMQFLFYFDLCWKYE